MQTLHGKTYKNNMGLNRHFPNAVYRGTPRYGGLAVAPSPHIKAIRKYNSLLEACGMGIVEAIWSHNHKNTSNLKQAPQSLSSTPTNRTHKKHVSLKHGSHQFEPSFSSVMGK